MAIASATATLAMAGLASLVGGSAGAADAAVEFRDEFVGRCFLADTSRSENPDQLESLFGYRRVVPEDAPMERRYEKSLTSGAGVVLTYLDAASAPDGVGVCTLSTDAIDGAAVRTAVDVWPGTNSAPSEPAGSGGRETRWLIDRPEKDGVLVMREDPGGPPMWITLSFTQ